MKANKILILSKPRFGSTTFINLLSQLYQYPKYNEPGPIMFNMLKEEHQAVSKVIVGKRETWDSIKDTLFSINWDMVILLRRNELHAKQSFQQLSKRILPENWSHLPKWEGWNVSESHVPYIKSPNIKIEDYVHDFYNQAEEIYEEIIGMNLNHIDITYENLYNEDVTIREQELEKVITHNPHWLVKKNVIKGLDPINKYGKLETKTLL